MVDSDHFHEICHTTVPEIRYMNEISHNIVRLVEAFNKESVRAAYTFDAGPNAVIYILQKDVTAFTAQVVKLFPPADGVALESYVREPSNEALLKRVQEAEVSPLDVDLAPKPGQLQYILSTRVGAGPRVISQHMLDESGVPK